MKRVASLLIAVTLGAAPAADSMSCLFWCATGHPATEDPAACHGLAQSDLTVRAADGECGILLEGPMFLREETRRESLPLALEHGGPIARSRDIVEGGRIGYPGPPVDPVAPRAFSAVLRI